MLGSAVLEVAIGVIFVFILVSTMCTAIREGIEALLRSRAAYLEYGIRELLHDRRGTGLAASLFHHPLVHGLYLGDYKPSGEIDSPPILANGKGLPSYIPARNFAVALLDIAARGPRTDLVSSDPSSPPLSVESVRANILNLQNPAVQRILLCALDQARGDLDAARANIEAWFDSGMQRVSGWYKRSTQWIVLAIAFCLTLALNIDTIGIAHFLYRNDAARSALVSKAEAATAEAALPSSGEGASRQLAELALPIGWSGEELKDPGLVWLTRVIGWVLTALAATLGAPFWFDLLNRFMVVRSTVKPDERRTTAPSGERPKDAELTVSPAAALVTHEAGHAHGTSSQGALAYSTLRDADSGIDACVPMDGDDTPDEQLPAATGGVA